MAKHKKDRIFRTANGHFLHLICGNCGERAVCYLYSQTKIQCKTCSSLLVRPTGGRAEIVGKTKSKRAENTY